ncbi:MAG: sulfatase [Lentisphaeria bacterium]|nr:sulfatase [Lentisphaeria bacterium]
MTDSNHGMIFTAGLAAAGLLATLPSLAQDAKRPNVLFIAVDDLRPELGCYGSAMVKSPNIDRLAAKGIVFERAYCQQAVCHPSRVSLLTGQRPDTTKVTDLFTKFREFQPDIVTLPQYFKANGYHTYRLGKIFHQGHGQTDDTESWTTVPNVKGVGYINARKGEKPFAESADVPDNRYRDGAITDDAVSAMQRFKKGGTPFFLAVGYVKPHLPFCAPKKYWDLYDRDAIPDALVTRPPEGIPAYALANFGELRKYDGIPATGPVSEAQRKELRHGYLACISYVDAQVGRLLDALKETGLEENTVIVLWGDHGWKLNDYGEWCKHTNLEIDTHVPLLLAAPGHKTGQRSKALVEFVDIYPTLSELCGLTVPGQCEGSSMVPLLETPDRSWKRAAFSQYPRRGLMGYSIRSGNWRYTEWIDKKTGEIKDRELYDHESGPLATRNQASDPALADTVKELSKKLDKGQGWKAFFNRR